MSKQHQRPFGYSDDEIDAMEAKERKKNGVLSDAEIEALEQAEKNKPLAKNERYAWLSARPIDFLSFGHGPEVVAATNSLLGAGTYEDELAKAEDLKRRYNEQTPWDDTMNLITGAIGLLGGGGTAGMIYKGARGVTGTARAAMGMRPAAQTVTGKAVQNTADLALTGAGGAGLYEMSEMPNDMSIPEKLSNVSGATLATGAVVGPVVGALGNVAIRSGQALRQAIRPDDKQAARWIADRWGKDTASNMRAKVMDESARTGKPANLASIAPQAVRDDVAPMVRGQRIKTKPGPSGADIAIGLAEVASTGSITAFLHRFGMGAIAAVLRQVGKGKRDQITRMLFSNDPAQVKQAAQMIETEIAGSARSAATRAAGTQTAAAQSSVASQNTPDWSTNDDSTPEDIERRKRSKAELEAMLKQGAPH